MANSPTPGPVILIVEDNMANLLLARTILERAGFQVAAAHSAEEAKRQLQRLVPALILMDIGLPGQDGLSLARELKSIPQTAAIPIIALTAHAMHGDEEGAIAAGCHAYVSKPYKARQLLHEIAAALQIAG